MNREPCVHTPANSRNGASYIGMTSDLMARHQHRNGLIPGFTARYGVKRPVHHAAADTMEAGIKREKQQKAWRLQ